MTATVNAGMMELAGDVSEVKYVGVEMQGAQENLFSCYFLTSQ